MAAAVLVAAGLGTGVPVVDAQAPPPSTTPPAPVDVAVRGRVLLPDGRPGAGAPVTLTVERGITEQIFGVLAFGLTLGVAVMPCLSPDPSPAARCDHDDSQRAVAGDDGTWTFRLPRAWVPGTLTDTKWHVTAAAGGAISDMRFKVRAAAPVTPDLRVWAPDVNVAADRVSWPALAGGGFEDPPRYEASWFDGAGKRMWVETTQDRSVTVDPRILEDAAGALGVVARANRWRAGIRYRFTHTAAAQRFTGTAGPPLSRGKPCEQRTTLGQEVLVAGACPATDGNLVTPLGDTTGPRCVSLPRAPSGISVPEVRLPPGVARCAEAPPAFTVDLGADHRVSLVVVRGCSGCVVEISTDHQGWRPVGEGPLVELGDAGLRARWVRVAGPDLASLAELSVWPATTPPPAPATTVGGVGRPRADDADDDADRSPWPIAFAAALLAVATAGTMAARRR